MAKRNKILTGIFAGAAGVLGIEIISGDAADAPQAVLDWLFGSTPGLSLCAVVVTIILLLVWRR